MISISTAKGQWHIGGLSVVSFLSCQRPALVIRERSVGLGKEEVQGNGTEIATFQHQQVNNRRRSPCFSGCTAWNAPVSTGRIVRGGGHRAWKQPRLTQGDAPQMETVQATVHVAHAQPGLIETRSVAGKRVEVRTAAPLIRGRVPTLACTRGWSAKLEFYFGAVQP